MLENLQACFYISERPKTDEFNQRGPVLISSLYNIHINAIIKGKRRGKNQIIVIDGKRRKSKRKYISIHIIESIVPRGIGSNHLTHCRILQ